MNRGSAFKWIDALSTAKLNDGVGLRHHDGTMSPVGVLCDFLDPEGWIECPIHGFLFHGEPLIMPPDFRKRVKAKTDTFGRVEDMIRPHSNSNPVNRVIFYIETEYSTL